MITLSEHTIEESIINKNGYILDLGCVNFSFSMDVKKYCDNIICVDPNPKIVNIPDGLIYKKCALVDNNEKYVDFFIYSDVQGHSLLNPSRDWCQLVNKVRVDAINLNDIMIEYGIEQFELIKFDIEGGEYKILENIDWTISKQFSIEFHDFRFMNPYYPNNEVYYQEIFKKLLVYCDIAQHNISNHPGFPVGAGSNYWDSLFILKKEYWK
jgi:FkbM family methyltransferase